MTSSKLKITFEYDGTWWDWSVEGDENARAPYCGANDTFSTAYDAVVRCIQFNKRNPYNPNARTEY